MRERFVNCMFVEMNGLDISLIIELVIELRVGRVVSRVVCVVARSLVMVCLVRLSVYRLVVSIGVAHRVHVVWVHGLVIMREFVWGLLTMHVMSCCDAVLIVSSMVSIGAGVGVRECFVYCMFVEVNWLNISLIVKLVIQLRVRSMVG